jgi:hypothetical protein
LAVHQRWQEESHHKEHDAESHEPSAPLLRLHVHLQTGMHDLSEAVRIMTTN